MNEKCFLVMSTVAVTVDTICASQDTLLLVILLLVACLQVRQPVFYATKLKMYILGYFIVILFSVKLDIFVFFSIGGGYRRYNS